MRRGIKASFTVEAAVILPLTLLILAALILTAFYLHDRAYLQGSACEIASAGANALTDRGQGEAMQKQKNQISVRMLMGSRGLSGQIQTGANQAGAFWHAVYPVPGLVSRYLTGGSLPISVSWEHVRIRAAEKIRIVRGINSLLSPDPAP